MSLLAFVFAAVVLAITPGPGIAYVVARTVAGGRSEGLASCFGTGIGGLLHVAAATLGLSALFFLAFIPQFTSLDSPLGPQFILLGSICVALNTLVDVIAVFGADRLLKSGAARAARARVLTRVSGFTMLSLGAFLALARREG